MSITPEHGVDPQSMFLKAISEGHTVVVTPEPAAEETPAGEQPRGEDGKFVKAEGEEKPKGEAKPTAEERLAALEAADEDDIEIGDNDIESLLKTLDQKLDSLRDTRVREAREEGDRRPEKTLREEIDTEDPGIKALLGAVEKISERLERMEQNDVAREEERADQRRMQFESQYAEGVVKFSERYPGFKDTELEKIGKLHSKAISQDRRLSALSFEEFSRRLLGEEVLETRRARGDANGKAKGSPPGPGRVSQPSGSPIPARSTGGGPPKKFVPGPGKGVNDVTDTLTRAGAWSRVFEQR